MPLVLRLPLALVLSSLIGCSAADGSGDTDESDDGGAGNGGGTYSVDGHVQKGPFANGTSMAVAELDASLTPTGLIFNTTIEDDTGSFDLANVELNYSLARLTADGFYYDENRGEVSGARLELHALVDLTDASTVNVNLLSHLERPRVEELIEGGMSFADAKVQAQEEILAVFAMSSDSMPNSEQLDISRGGEADAKLLAISVILQGYRTVGEMSELLSAISTDLREDGTLDSESTGSALMNAAVLVDLEQTRSNLETRYDMLGVAAEIGDFESHVQSFVDNSDFAFTDYPTYPTDVVSGDNLLDPDQTEYTQGEHSLTAQLPLGTSLMVRLTRTGQGVWWYTEPNEWDVSDFDWESGVQEFTATIDDGEAHMTLTIEEPAAATIEYFENGATEPTRTKQITWDCSSGNCTCPDEQTKCGDACVATKEDPNNCGECGISCEDHQECVDGECSG